MSFLDGTECLNETAPVSQVVCVITSWPGTAILKSYSFESNLLRLNAKLAEIIFQILMYNISSGGPPALNVFNSSIIKCIKYV